MSGVKAYVGLGANVGDRRAAIEGALRRLAAVPGIDLVAASPVLETAPEGPPGQGRYLNAAAELRTTLSPRELLATLLAIEAEHGRDRGRERRWGPRTLDLDLLMYGDRVIDEPGLTVPHPRLHRRLFVLQPLAAIAAEAVHPGLGTTVECLRQRAASAGTGARKAPMTAREDECP